MPGGRKKALTSEIEDHIRSFFNSFYSVYRLNYEKFADLFLMAYERSPATLSDIDRAIVKTLNSLIDAARAERRDTLHEMKEFVERYRSEYRYVYVIDCIGLPDLYALWSSAIEKRLIPIVKIFINREAKTVSFREAFGAESMKQVATDFSGQMIRKPDEMLHAIFTTPMERNEFVKLLAWRMSYMARESQPRLEKGTMILSDHGYDVICDGSKYVASHINIPRARIALAKLAPVMLLKS